MNPTSHLFFESTCTSFRARQLSFPTAGMDETAQLERVSPPPPYSLSTEVQVEDPPTFDPPLGPHSAIMHKQLYSSQRETIMLGPNLLNSTHEDVFVRTLSGKLVCCIKSSTPRRQRTFTYIGSSNVSQSAGNQEESELFTLHERFMSVAMAWTAKSPTGHVKFTFNWKLSMLGKARSAMEFRTVTEGSWHKFDVYGEWTDDMIEVCYHGRQVACILGNPRRHGGKRHAEVCCP